MTNGNTAIDDLRTLSLRRRLRAGDAGRLVGLAVQHHFVHADRTADIFDVLLAEILETDRQTVGNLIAHRGGNADAARLRQPFKPRGDVDAVAEDIVVLDDDVAQIDADAIEQRARRGHVAIAPRHPFLEIDRAAQRLGDALKFHQQTVAGGLDDAALAVGDRRIDQLKPHGFEPGQRPSFVDFHQTAIADHVRGQNRGQAALHVRAFRVHAALIVVAQTN